jgi:hypothetical protein
MLPVDMSANRLLTWAMAFLPTPRTGLEPTLSGPLRWQEHHSSRTGDTRYDLDEGPSRT